MAKPLSFYESLGLLLQICYHDEKRYRWFNTLDFANNLANPVSLGQCFIWFHAEKKHPAAFLTWALMDEKTEQYFLEHDKMPGGVEAWKSGNRLWLMDFVSPFGSTNQYVREVCRTIFKDYPSGRIVRHGKHNDIRRYGKFHNPYYKK